MRNQELSKTIRRQDYLPPSHWIRETRLQFDLQAQSTEVVCVLQVEKNPASDIASLTLDGEHLTLLEVMVDGQPLAAERYRLTDTSLTLYDLPEKFSLTTRVRIHPANNTALEGLYMSNGMYCTQCEAEGFRRITYYPDRPDVLSIFETTIIADQQRYPLLLSNGNLVASENLPEGRHKVVWQDPFPKPCYLFALVAGDLSCLEDSFVTRSGRTVALKIFAEHQDLDKLDFAMASLKNAMKWDEDVYGREYDLDIFMVVAVSHFNMGAMENKGLNIFNTSCVLAHPDTTTDQGYQRVESVVAHEYFHNWSGNRVTCRDWFQLSLKEGLTVFRDQQFSADMQSAAVQRIEDVDMLRTHQFAEDAGPMSHPVRPEAYEKIDNFYTLTIYEKGAEVVRMQHTLLGAEKFRKATDLYFERFDGQAVTCDDFVDCMETVSGENFSQFRRWYSQAGTPRVFVTTQQQGAQLTLTVRQSASDNRADYQPLVIPLRFSLLGENGNLLALNAQGDTEQLLVLKEKEQQWHFEALDEVATPLLFKQFSAPVLWEYHYSDQQLNHILARADDGFSRWDAAQRLYQKAVGELLVERSLVEVVAPLAATLQQVLLRHHEDAAITAKLMTLPTAGSLIDIFKPVNPALLQRVLLQLEKALAEKLQTNLQATIASMTPAATYRATAQDIGQRALVNRCLSWLASLEEPAIGEHLVQRYQNATNMTDRLNALRLLVNYYSTLAAPALENFYQRYQQEPLALDQWFSVQASAPSEQGIKVVEALLKHPHFDWKLPNRVRAVLGAFVSANLLAFHAADGSGYRLYAQAIATLDRLNPQVAARMANVFGIAPKLPELLHCSMANEVSEAIKGNECSQNLSEVLGRIFPKTVGKM